MTSEKGENSEAETKLIFLDWKEIKLTKTQAEILKNIFLANKGRRFIPLSRPIK